jgi:hypothetical protein
MQAFYEADINFFLQHSVRKAPNADGTFASAHTGRGRDSSLQCLPNQWSMQRWYQRCRTQSLAVCKNKRTMHRTNIHQNKKENGEKSIKKKGICSIHAC